jgi:hypothetical protein
VNISNLHTHFGLDPDINLESPEEGDPGEYKSAGCPPKLLKTLNICSPKLPVFN